MKNDLLDQLIESREQLTSLKAIDCRMAHERVLIDRRTQLPVAGAVPEFEFERRGLCSAGKRLKNPACGHTMARYRIETALDNLPDHAEFLRWRGELAVLTDSIHTLDHRKGEAEKQSANLIKNKHHCFEKIEKDRLERQFLLIKHQINEMENLHSLFSAQIEQLKNNILAAINEAIRSEVNG